MMGCLLQPPAPKWRDQDVVSLGWSSPAFLWQVPGLIPTPGHLTPPWGLYSRLTGGRAWSWPKGWDSWSEAHVGWQGQLWLLGCMGTRVGQASDGHDTSKVFWLAARQIASSYDTSHVTYRDAGLNNHSFLKHPLTTGFFRQSVSDKNSQSVCIRQDLLGSLY